MTVREFVFGVPAGVAAQGTAVHEVTWDAISVYEGPAPPPPPSEFKFPWWLVGIGAAAAAIISTRSVLKKEKYP